MKRLLCLFSAMFLFAACAPSKDGLKKVLVENPDILYAVIEKNPDGFFDTVQKASREAQVRMREKQQKEEEGRMEEEYKNPKKPVITDQTPSRGPKDAPITIVEYSDFQCPFCGKGYKTVKEVEEKYKGKVRFIFKNLPLENIHPLARPAANYFVALTMQSPEKAFKFHDIIFENQDKLNSGKEKFLEETAKKVGADMAKLKKDMASESVSKAIEADMKEAQSYEINGTPGFIVNGVSIRGAVDAPEMEKVIEKTLSEKK